MKQDFMAKLTSDLGFLINHHYICMEHLLHASHHVVVPVGNRQEDKNPDFICTKWIFQKSEIYFWNKIASDFLSIWYSDKYTNNFMEFLIIHILLGKYKVISIFFI